MHIFVFLALNADMTPSTLGGATLEDGWALQLQIQSGLPESLSGAPDIGTVALDGRIFFALSPRIDLALGARAAAIPAIGAGPLAELRVQAYRRANFALALDAQLLTAFIGGDAGVAVVNLSLEVGLTMSSWVSHFEIFYGAMEVTHVIVSEVASQSAALRLGFAYHFAARSIFYHMDIGPPVYPVWGGRRDTWWYLPLVRVAVGCQL